MRPTWILGCSAVLALAALPASAQPVVAAKSGTISLAEGKVLLDEKPLDIQPGQFPDMKEKSVLRTEDGRAEVLLPPGMFLRIGENATTRMVSNRLIDTRMELLKGSGVVEIDNTSKDSQVTMLCKDATVTFAKGIYRFDADSARLKVFEGNASVAVGGRSLTVSSGKMIGLTGDTASVEHFDVKDTDSLDHWSRRRGEDLAMANVSAARRASTSSWAGGYNPCMGSGFYGAPYMPSAYALGPGGMGGAWAYNPWYGMITYMPCSGMLMSPYGFGFWSPWTVGNLFYGYGYYGLYPRGGYGYGYGGGTPVRGIGGTGRPGTYSGIASHSGSGFHGVGGTTAGGMGRTGGGGFAGGGYSASGGSASSSSGSSGGGFGGGHSSGGGFSGGGFGGGHGGGGGGGHH